MSKEDVLRKFYERVSKSNSVTNLGIPPSIVFFVRRALEDTTGVPYTLEHVECSLFLEGYLDPDRFFIDGLPSWYAKKYLTKDLDMRTLRGKLRYKYHGRLLERQKREISSSEDTMVSGPDIRELQ